MVKPRMNTPKKSYIRSTTVEKLDRQRQLLDRLYDHMRQGQEMPHVSNDKLATTLGVTPSQMADLARTMEKTGILARRVQYGISPNIGKFFHWTLLVSKADAIALLDKAHEKERKRMDRAPAPKNTLKNRILAAIQQYEEFPTVEHLILTIAKPGEQIDPHSATHLLNSLKRQGIVAFNTTSSLNGKDKIPENIRLVRVHRNGNGKPREGNFEPMEVLPGERSSEAAMRLAGDEGKPVLPEPLPIDKPDTTDYQKVAEQAVQNGTEFPNIVRKVHKKKWLEQAASLAEMGDEDELALELMERAKKSFTDYDLEVINLWQRYQECQGRVED